MNQPIHELVRSSDYFRSVLSNMGGPKADSTVRFGTEGNGVAPNYEVISSTGKIVPFRGLGHKQNLDVAQYDEANLSGSHTYAEVQELLKKSLSTGPIRQKSR